MHDRARIRSALAPLEGEWRETRFAGDGTTIAEAAASEGFDAVVAVGGDGTVNEVANGLMRITRERRPAFGLVPEGTGNDYARMLGLKVGDAKTAADVLAKGEIRTLDAGEVAGRFFANSVGFGFDGAVAENAATRRFIKGFPAYLVSVVAVLRTWRNFELHLEADGRVLDGPSLLGCVAIGITSGGGFRLTPGAIPDDGLFDVCRLGDFGRLESLRHLPSAITGKHATLAKVTLLRAKSVTLRSDRPAHRAPRRKPPQGRGTPRPARLPDASGGAARDRKMGRWCPGAELNRRHRAFQARALPTELPGQTREATDPTPGTSLAGARREAPRRYKWHE